MITYFNTISINIRQNKYVDKNRGHHLMVSERGQSITDKQFVLFIKLNIEIHIYHSHFLY